MSKVEAESIISGIQSLSLIRMFVVIHFIYLTDNFWAFINSASWTSKSSLSIVENIYKYKEIHKYFEYIKLYDKFPDGWNLNYAEGTGIKEKL